MRKDLVLINICLLAVSVGAMVCVAVPLLYLLG